jgi:hypothetical protein
MGIQDNFLYITTYKDLHVKDLCKIIIRTTFSQNNSLVPIWAK